MYYKHLLAFSEKVRTLFKKDTVFDSAIFLLLGFIFLVLEWRLFIFGSDNQLFLYGDNLTAYNNLFYIFSNFHLGDIFGTFVGQNGMFGSYPMAEPQNSIFYFPITVLLIIFKALHLGAIGLYYELLFLHTFHFVLGTFFIYKIAQKILRLDRNFSFLASLVYMGLGWNVAWFGTLTLSYMIGLLPLAFFTFFHYVRSGKVRDYAWFVLSLSLLLYAGGIVNFFFYVMLNCAILYGAFFFFRFDSFLTFVSKRSVIMKGILVLVVAPVLALMSYTVQLFSTYRVSVDIFHSSSSYDYLAFFGMHFYDLVGLIIPKFALLNFGSVTNPQIILEFSLANILYIGIIPLLVLFLGATCLKNRTVYLLTFLSFLNFLLAFGGAFFLYDMTYFFPGNNLFRGHYKYLFLFGVYVALLVPLILSRWQEQLAQGGTYQKIMKGVRWMTGAFLFLGIIAACAAFTLKVLQKTMPELLQYYTLGMTFTNYFFRVALLIGFSLLSIHIFLKYRNTTTILLLAFVLLLDTSINYKYVMLSRTPVEALTSKKFFDCCQGKTVVNDIDKYSQLYFLSEILEVNPVFQYSAIPNRYVVDYNGHLPEKGGFSYPMLAAAGIDGVLTTNIIDDPQFTLESTKKVTRDNYTNLYLYNADGDIHNDWGERNAFVGSSVRYYSIKDATPAYFTTLYKEKTNEGAVWDYLESEEFNQYAPALLLDKRVERDRSGEQYMSQASFLENRPTYKKIQAHNEQTDGVFFVNVPYASIWKAKVSGEEETIYRANGAFSAVRIHEKNAIIELYIDKRPYFLALGISILFFTLLAIPLFLSDEQLIVARQKMKNFWYRKNSTI